MMHGMMHGMMRTGVHGSPGVVELPKHGLNGNGQLATGRSFSMNAALKESEEVLTGSTSPTNTADSEKKCCGERVPVTKKERFSKPL